MRGWEEHALGWGSTRLRHGGSILVPAGVNPWWDKRNAQGVGLSITANGSRGQQSEAHQVQCMSLVGESVGCRVWLACARLHLPLRASMLLIGRASWHCVGI